MKLNSEMRVAEEKRELIRWWDAMDAIAGQAGWRQNVALGVQMARESRHRDAVWLASLFPGTAPVTERALMAAMQTQCDEDPRALFFRAVLGHDKVLLRRVAEMDFAPAQAVLSTWVKSAQEGFEFAEKAAVSADRNGMYLLGERYQVGRGCARDTRRMLMLYGEAAKLGHPGAQIWFGMNCFAGDNVERYRWWGRATGPAFSQGQYLWEDAAAKQLKRFDEGGSGQCVFEIGRWCGSRVDVLTSLPAPDKANCAKEIQILQRAIALHREWSEKATRAIECWIWVARQLGVVKDIRQVIARQAWESAWMWSRPQVLDK